MEFKNGIYHGTQEEVAAAVMRWLYTRATRDNVTAMLGFMRTQRAFGNPVFTWRGIGIDTTPRHCKCWIADGNEFSDWLKRGDRNLPA